MPSLEDRSEHAGRVLDALEKTHPEARCALDYRTAFQLAVATVLSAQCTDERVNRVTPHLFARYPDAGSLAAQMCDVIRAAGAEHRTLVASFVEAETLSFRAACPEIATAATPPEGFRFWLLGALSGEHPPPDALIVPNRIGPLRIATRAFVESARRQGLRVHSWLANEWQEVVSLHDAGLDAILTDHPERVSRWLREHRVE